MPYLNAQKGAPIGISVELSQYQEDFELTSL